MKRDELHAKLRLEFKPGRSSCGVVRLEDPNYRHAWFVVPPPPPRDRPGDLPLKALTRAHKVLSRLPFISDSDELDRLVSYLLIRREAVQSSRMEGTLSTIDQVLTPGEIWEDPSRRNERSSVIGYATAIDREIENCRRRGVAIFDASLVGRIHKNVMEKEPHFKGKPGAIRTEEDPRSVVWIGGGGRLESSIYNPTPPRYVGACLQDVMAWMADEELVDLGEAGMGLSLPLRLAIGHSHFEAVHPFTDGNGRVGRVLMTLQMACTGKIPVYMSGFIEAEKSAYVKALSEAQKRLSYGAIVEFICEALVSSFEEGEVTKTAIRSMPSQWRERGGFRAKSAAERALDLIVVHPIFTAKMLEKKLEVSTPAVMRAVKQLVDAGIVRERTGFVRNRVFAAEEVIEIMARDYGRPVQEAMKAARLLLKS